MVITDKQLDLLLLIYKTPDKVDYSDDEYTTSVMQLHDAGLVERQDPKDPLYTGEYQITARGIVVLGTNNKIDVRSILDELDTSYKIPGVDYTPKPPKISRKGGRKKKDDKDIK
jgi:hypothetical protein